MKSESQIRERLKEVKESWNKYYKKDFRKDKDPYVNLDTDTLMSASAVESEITTLEWILGMKHSYKQTENFELDK